MTLFWLLFFLGTPHFLRKGPCLVKADNNVNNGGLVVSAGETLTVNTSAVLATDSNGNNYNLSFRNYSYETTNVTWNYTVARLSFVGNVSFESGSTVNLTGSNALAIISQNGSIVVNTTVNLTNPVNDSSTMFLGGYGVSTQPEKNFKCDYMYQGLGPGASRFHRGISPNGGGHCIPSAGHGGHGGQGKHKEFGNVYGKPYGLQANNTLGGSGGTCYLSRGMAFGGGALELVADRREITIGGKIIADAQNVTDDCSGGSGGFIRLKARKITVLDNAVLSVKGGSAGRMRGVCGAGGVIQIIGSCGKILNKSRVIFENGRSTCGNDMIDPGIGTLIIKDSNRTVFKGNVSEGNFTWGSCETGPTASTVTTSTQPSRRFPEVLANGSRPLSAANIKDFLAAMGNVTLGAFDHDAQQEIMDTLLEVTNKTLDEANVDIWFKTRKEMLQLIDFVEDFSVKTLPIVFHEKTTGNHTVLMPNVAVTAVKYDKKAGEDIRLPSSTDNASLWKGYTVELPAGAVNGLEAGFTFLVIQFRVPGRKDRIDRQVRDIKVVSSNVVSCTLLDANYVTVRTINTTARLWFGMKEGFSQSNKNCSYLEEDQSWSNEGVKKVAENTTHTECSTSHFTNFAILIGAPHVVDAIHAMALSVVTYIGSGLSIGGLALTLLVYLSMEVLNSERLKIHANLSFALLLGHITFLSGVTETEDPVLCQAIAIILHYFFMTAFGWMLIEGIHLYLKVIQVYGSENINMRLYYVFGWGFSAVIVAISASIRPNNYGTDHACWLSDKDGLIWAFVGPVVLYSAINLIILIKVAKTVAFSASGVNTPDKADIMAGAKCVGVLMPILGLAWVFGLLAFQKESSIVFQYLFAIANSSQGLFIFLFFCVFNQEVRRAYQRRKEKQSLTRSLGYANDQSLTDGARPPGSTFKLSTFEKASQDVTIEGSSRPEVLHVEPMTAKQDSATSAPIHVIRTFARQRSKDGADEELGPYPPGAIN